jgi:hypothetical protein
VAGHPDDTVIVSPSADRGRRRVAASVLVGVLLIGAIGVGGYWLMERQAPVAGAPAPAAVEPIPVASEAAIQAESPAVRTVLRLGDNPAVVVIDFPTLAEQGRMLNRVAAWAEKAGVPHDQVPSEATMASAIAGSGSTADTYYYGHDYSGATLARFFALADEEHVPPRPEEEELRRIATRARAERAGFGAVITLVRADAANGVTMQTRATILHHELSHGEYFTNPAYSAFVTTFWQTVMTASERAAVRSYLAQEGYDPALEDLMRNEMQAYLMFTPDPAFFDPDRLGIATARLAQLRQLFLTGMPPGWLRDALAASGTVPTTPKPRLRQGSGRVSIGRAVAATVPPRRRRASTAV